MIIRVTLLATNAFFYNLEHKEHSLIEANNNGINTARLLQSYFNVFSFQKLLLKDTLSKILNSEFCLWYKAFLLLLLLSYKAGTTVQKMKFFIKDFFSKCEQICSFLFLFPVKTFPQIHSSFWKLFALMSCNLQRIKLKNDAKLVPLPYSSLIILLHGFSITIRRRFKDTYINSFFLRTAKLCSFVPAGCFSLSFSSK